MAVSFIDFYIGYPGHPRFRTPELIEDDVVRIIIQKYEMIIFTNKGEVYGEYNFGANLPELLHETMLSADVIQQDIEDQITTYIPEIMGINYELSVEFHEHPEDYSNYMVIYFKIRDYEVYASVS